MTKKKNFEVAFEIFRQGIEKWEQYCTSDFFEVRILLNICKIKSFSIEFVFRFVLLGGAFF